MTIKKKKTWQPTQYPCQEDPMDRGAKLTTQSVGSQRIRHDLAAEQQLHSTGNYTQYSVINHYGKEYLKKEYICIYLNHFAVPQKLTRHKSTIFQ